MNCPNCNSKCKESVVENKIYYQCRECPFNQIENNGQVGVIYIWFFVDEYGNELIIDLNQYGKKVQAVTTSLEIAKTAKKQALELNRETGAKIILKQFSNAQVIEGFGL